MIRWCEISGETNATLVVNEQVITKRNHIDRLVVLSKGHINTFCNKRDLEIYQDCFSFCDDDLDGKAQRKFRRIY